LALALFLALGLFNIDAATAIASKSVADKPAKFSPGSGDIDERLSAVEAELFQLTSKLEQLKQDSVKAAAELSGFKASAGAKTGPLESLLSQKTQELSGIKSQRDKARQDSIALAAKRNDRMTANKQEAARIDAAKTLATSQLTTMNARKQQLTTDDAGGESKAVSLILKDIARDDSLIHDKKSETADWEKKRDQLRQDSISEESKASDSRTHIQIENKRLDSLLQISSTMQGDAAGKSAKSKELTTNLALEQAKLGDAMRQKTVVEAQIARIKGEISTVNAERTRLRAVTGASQKKSEQDRSSLSETLAAAEAKLQEKIEYKETISALIEKFHLDSAIHKAKEALNSAIEQQAMDKKGAEKLVNQREVEVTQLLVQLDDVVRKHSKLSQEEAQLSGLSTSAEKHNRLDSLLSGAAAALATQTSLRDKANRDLNEFDRTRPVVLSTSTKSLAMLDSLSSVKEKSGMTLAAKRDSIENLIAFSQRSVETMAASARLEAAKADSATSAARKQRADLMVQRAQIRTDSIKSESSLMVAMIRLRTEQAKTAFRTAALDREITNLNAAKERLKQSVIDTRNRDKQVKAAGQQERNRLDSLIGAKEQEIAQISKQNEKLPQDLQLALKDLDQLVKKQSSLISSASSQITSAEQDISAISQEFEAARKERLNEEKSIVEKIGGLERDKTAIAASITAKKNEIANLKYQRGGRQRGLKREMARLDSLIGAAEKISAGYAAVREKARQDSIAAEAAKSEAQVKSIAALHIHDSLAAELQQQMAETSADFERVRQDSISKSAPVSGGEAHIVKALDSLIAIKERELSDVRQQREKARLDGAAEQRRQLAALAAAHHEVINRRTLLEQKRAEMALMETKRHKIQKDSSMAFERFQMAAQTAGTEASRQSGIIVKKTDDLAALKAQRADILAKLAAMNVESTQSAFTMPSPAAPPAPAAAGNAPEAGQKQLEEKDKAKKK
jgi:hypothetical protein